MATITTSTVILYYGCKILPEKVFKVDSIETYLSTFVEGTTKRTISNFQYIKHQLSIDIRIPSLQQTIEGNAPTCNYCSIRNSDDGNIVYYFVTKEEWLSTGGVKLSLFMDTINTYVGQTNFALSDKTKILRQHLDRYQSGDVSNLKPIIDRYTEGFQPQLYGGDNVELDETSLNTSWYLIYRNQNEPSESLVNPVNCYLVPGEELFIDSYSKYHVKVSLLNLRVALTAQYPSQYVYFIGKFNPTLTFVFTDNNSSEVRYWSLNDGTRFCKVYTDTSTIHFELYSNDGSLIDSITNPTAENVEFTNLYTAKYGAATDNDISQAYIYPNASFPVDRDFDTPSNSRFVSDFAYIKGINAVDRTRSELIKIIQLPYRPIPLSQTNATPIATYTFNTSDWTTDYVSGMEIVLKLNYLGYNLQRDLSFTISNDNNPYWPLRWIPKTSIDTDAYKDINLEPKLYHSDYYQPKLIYDSFSFPFKLELVTKDFISVSDFKLNYRVANTMNSRFAFKITDYVCTAKETQDFNNLLVITRNNEIPIFNQQYINYIRNGYNYDVKNKNRQEATMWVSTGLQIAGAVAGYVGAAFTGGATLPAAVGLTASSAASLTNAVTNTIQLEQNLQSKEAQLKAQTTSVAGSDDVDLMDYYCNNRCAIKIYQISHRMKEALFNLFYYTGYVSNVLGVPNTNTRSRFNFVSAEIVFENTPNVSKEILDDITMRYKAGITFLHYYKNTWDFAQEHENWETSLIS